MEPDQTEAGLSEFHILLTLGKALVHVTIHSEEVRFNSTWRLSSHLNRSLQERDGESYNRRSRHEDSEAGLEVASSEHIVHDVFELRQEVDGEMAVTQEAPVSIKRRLHHHTLSTFSLSLTKGNRHYLNLDLISETLELLSRVNTRSHHKDNGSLRSRLIVDLLDRGGLGAGKISSLEVGVNEIDDRESHSVRSEASEDDHLFHVIITLALPFSRKLSLLRLGLSGGEPAEPLFSIELNVSSESLVEFNLLL